MKQKKTKIKIKRSKVNLYNKKKSKTRRTLSIVITIAAACILGVVGYGIGKPVMDYLNNRNLPISDSSDPWNSDNSDDSGNTGNSDDSQSSDNSSGSENTSGEQSSSDTQTSTPSVPVSSDTRMYVLPADAAVSSASLNSALAAAKESGCGVAVVTLKVNSGDLLYKSDIPVVKDSEIIKGSLSAAQICGIITSAGLTPAARISTLMDSEYPKFAGGYMIVGGGAWLDDYPDHGGKRWLSPFDKAALDYIGKMCGELSEAGFKHIICADTMYPTFHKVDLTTHLSDLPLSSSSKRTEALRGVVTSAKTEAEKNGCSVWLEFSESGLLAEDKTGTDAEILLDMSGLSDVGLIAKYSVSAENAYQNAKDFAAALKSGASGADNTAVLIGAGISESARAEAQKAFTEAGVAVFRES